MDLLSLLMSARKTKCWHSHLTKKNPERQTRKCIFACCRNTFQRAENAAKPLPRAFAAVQTSSLCSLSVVGWQPPQVQWVSLASSKHKQRKRVWVGHVVLFYLFIYFSFFTPAAFLPPRRHESSRLQAGVHACSSAWCPLFSENIKDTRCKCATFASTLILQACRANERKTKKENVWMRTILFYLK